MRHALVANPPFDGAFRNAKRLGNLDEIQIHISLLTISIAASQKYQQREPGDGHHQVEHISLNPPMLEASRFQGQLHDQTARRLDGVFEHRFRRVLHKTRLRGEYFLRTMLVFYWAQNPREPLGDNSRK